MTLISGKIRSSIFAMVGAGAYCLTIIRCQLQGRAIELPNYTLLEPGLFIGGACTNPPPNTRAVLNLSSHLDDYTVEEYRWQPLHSGVAPTLQWLREQVDFIDSCRRAGKAIFVHCDAGIDRSASVVAAYLMWHKHITSDAAIELVQRKRAVARPSPMFLRLLNEWQAVQGTSVF
ncbi:MAG: dual specificity protein phosphatase [Phycisphaerae bacterium]